MTEFALRLQRYLRVYGMSEENAADWLDSNCAGWREHEEPIVIDLGEVEDLG